MELKDHADELVAGLIALALCGCMLQQFCLAIALLARLAANPHSWPVCEAVGVRLHSRQAAKERYDAHVEFRQPNQ